jgi:hypothetical protein
MHALLEPGRGYPAVHSQPGLPEPECADHVHLHLHGGLDGDLEREEGVPGPGERLLHGPRRGASAVRLHRPVQHDPEVRGVGRRIRGAGRFGGPSVRANGDVVLTIFFYFGVFNHILRNEIG